MPNKSRIFLEIFPIIFPVPTVGSLRNFWPLHVNGTFVGTFCQPPACHAKWRCRKTRAGAEAVAPAAAFLFAFHSMAASSHCCCNCLCRTWHLASPKWQDDASGGSRNCLFCTELVWFTFNEFNSIWPFTIFHIPFPICQAGPASIFSSLIQAVPSAQQSNCWHN